MCSTFIYCFWNKYLSFKYFFVIEAFVRELSPHDQAMSDAAE